MRCFVFPFFRDLEQGSVEKATHTGGLAVFSGLVALACNAALALANRLRKQSHYAS